MAEMNCTLCLEKVVFPVRFVADGDREVGQDYHLIAACMLLAERLLKSHGADLQIQDDVNAPIVSLVQVEVEGRFFCHFNGEEICDEASRGRGENVQALALKLAHAFTNCERESGQMRSLNKNDWVRFRDEFQEENGEKCWAMQLLHHYRHMGSGPGTFLLAGGSLVFLAIREVYNSVVNPGGRSEEKERTPPLTVVRVPQSSGGNSPYC